MFLFKLVEVASEDGSRRIYITVCFYLNMGRRAAIEYDKIFTLQYVSI